MYYIQWIQHLVTVTHRVWKEAIFKYLLNDTTKPSKSKTCKQLLKIWCHHSMFSENMITNTNMIQASSTTYTSISVFFAIVLLPNAIFIYFACKCYMAEKFSECLHLCVPSVQQKSSGLKFPKSHSSSDVTYSCHHNSSRFTFPIFVHSWHFSVFHSLQSITPCIY